MMSIFSGIGRDYTYNDLFSPVDQDHVLGAIRSLVSHTRTIEAARQEQFSRLEQAAKSPTDDETNAFIVSQHDDLAHQSVYEDCALGHAIVGALAPFFESIFKTGLPTLWTRVPGPTKARLQATPHLRWQMKNPVDAEKFYDGKKNKIEKNFAAAVPQVLGLLGIEQHFPPDLPRVLQALTAFRNQAFHNGFEWPKQKVSEFSARIKAHGWQGWFACATEGGSPWIHYMSEQFVDLCVQRADDCLLGFSAACKALDVSHHRNSRPPIPALFAPSASPPP